MAQYPEEIYTPRTMVNRNGATYDATRTKDIYAEDFNYDRAEIVAIQNELGVTPKGAFASVAAYLAALASAVGGIVTDFLGLSDTPSSYVGQGGKVVAVKSDVSGLEFIDAPGGAVDSVNGQTGAVVLDPDDLDDSATTNKFATSDELSKLAGIEAGAEVNNISDANATDLTGGGETDLHSHPGGSSPVVQIVSVLSSNYATTSTRLPLDDTLPQKTEGGEFLTLSITPQSASNKLRIQAVLFFASNVNNTHITAAVFKDTDSDAIAVASQYANQYTIQQLSLDFIVDCSSTDARTYKIRAGVDAAAALYFNGRSGASVFSSAIKSSLIITEFTP